MQASGNKLSLLLATAFCALTLSPPASGEEQAVNESAVGEAVEEDTGADGKAPATAPAASDSEPSIDPVGEYLEAIRREEVSRGAYSPQLADLYLGLGQTLLKSGQYLEARDAYQKGMQVTRVNNGLHSLGQEPFLFSLAELDYALGDRESSNDALNHILQINSEVYGPRNERMLPVLNRMLHWYMDRYRGVASGGGLDHLINGEKLAAQIVSIHLDTLNLSHDEAPESFRKLSAVEFALARHVSTHGLPGEQEAFTYSFGAVPQPVSRVPSIVDDYYRRGRDALKATVQLLSEEEGVSRRELAAAVAELADWYAAFDKHFSAEEHYQLAYRLLGESEDTRELQETFFAEPRLITFNSDQPPVAAEGTPGEVLEITLDITDRGVPRNLRLKDESGELGVRDIKQIKREVGDFRFRPQLVNGEPVGTEDYVYHYQIQRREGDHES